MSELSKSQRKELRRAKEHEQQVAAELKRERRIGEDPSWQGIGERVLQIRQIGPFWTGRVWDIRRIAGKLLLYVSTVNPKKPGYVHPGYRSLAIDPERLATLFNNIQRAKISAWVPAAINMGLDGTTTQVDFRSGCALASLTWWEAGPKEWHELVAAVTQAIGEFEALPDATESGKPKALTRYDKNKSPVGWYLGSYLLRFIELNQAGNDDPERRFLAWENTIIVQAKNLDDAYDEVVAEAMLATEPYLGGPDAIPVQWVFEGVTELLPIYEELEHRAEIMYAEHDRIELKNLRKRVRLKYQFAQ